MNGGTAFGQWLKGRRKALGLTQKELAEAIGCAAMTVVKIEGGDRRPSKQMAELLAGYLQIPSEERAAFVEFARAELAAGQPSPNGTENRAPWLRQLRCPNNLPAQTTTFIGRESQVSELTALLHRLGVRLLTLSGPPGIGKTRLGLRLATELVNEYEDGVFYVALAPIREPNLVADAIAQTLGIVEIKGRPILETLKEELRDKRMLLLLDNFEQVTPAASMVADLLAAAPNLKVLVTSRTILHIYGEHDFPVPPLSMPQEETIVSLERVTEYEAICLFTERAVATGSNLALTDQDILAIVEICRRLDGLPLAIELAAARAKVLPPQALISRLENRLALLVGGPQDVSPRHQTLRNAIDWSYNLLTPPEMALFRRMSVFVTGGTLSAVEAVCNPDGTLGIEVLDGIMVLLDKSLLHQENTAEGESCFRMLETLREYGVEMLAQAEDDEAETVRERHARYFLSLTEQAKPEMLGPNQVDWLDRLESEYDNIRAALGWAITHEKAEIAGRLAVSLACFWHLRGRAGEGRQWLLSVLKMGQGGPQGRQPMPAPLPARVLREAGVLARQQGDLEQAASYYEQSLALYRYLGDKEGIGRVVTDLGDLAARERNYEQATVLLLEGLALRREVGDRPGIAASLNILGVMARHEGDGTSAATLLEESLTLWRQLGNKRGIAGILNNLGTAVHDMGDFKRAKRCYEESLALRRELGDKPGLAVSYTNLGILARHEGDYERAQTLGQKSLALRRELGNESDVGYALNDLGLLATRLGNYDQARSYHTDSLKIFQTLNDRANIAGCLECLAGVVYHAQPTEASAEAAAWIFGAAQAQRDAINARREPENLADYNHNLAAARSQISDAGWQAAWEQGRSMPMEQVIALAVNEHKQTALRY